jgi:16S rRNA (guanine1207-N2)-methyltransferase
LDPGTELLLANLPKLRRLRSEIPVRILDFGCGCGVVGFCLHLLYPEFQIEMVDISLLALESAKRSAKINSFKVKIFPSCGLTEVEKGLSAIVTNPPFHQGVKQDTRTTQQFLQNCSAFLLKGGSLILVANRFLPYADWIDRYVGKSTVLAENSKFRVYHAVKN